MNVDHAGNVADEDAETQFWQLAVSMDNVRELQRTVHVDVQFIPTPSISVSAHKEVIDCSPSPPIPNERIRNGHAYGPNSNRLSTQGNCQHAELNHQYLPIAPPAQRKEDPKSCALADHSANSSASRPAAPTSQFSLNTRPRLLFPKPKIIKPGHGTKRKRSTGATYARTSKRHRKAFDPYPRISPTDLSGSEWCELQWIFLRTYGRKLSRLQQIGCMPDLQVTKSLNTGTLIHTNLELELHAKVHVKTKTAEDRFAISTSLLQSIFCFHELATKRMTREIPVKGIVHHAGSGKQFYMTGIIDQLELCTTTKDGQEPVTEIVISDFKTTSSNAVPKPSYRSKPVQIQLFSYYHLLTSTLAGTCSKETTLKAADLIGDMDLNAEILAYIQTLPHPIRTLIQKAAITTTTNTSFKSSLTLNDIVTAHNLMASQLLTKCKAKCVSTSMTARYRNQETKLDLGVVRFEYSHERFDGDLQTFLDMVVGDRLPKGVDDIETVGLKCGRCEYAPACGWRAQRHSELMTHCD